jgi:hypothetical protein
MPVSLTSRSNSSSPRDDLGLWQPGPPQPIGDIVGHRHMWKQRVILEHDVDRPRRRRHRRHVDAINLYATAVNALEPGQHAQQCRLAASRRPQQAEQLAPVDIKRQIINSQDIAEAPRHIPDSDKGGHGQPDG